MSFEWAVEGPAENCRAKCREWISARGTIGSTTLRDFQAFAQERDVRGATIVLESTGGAVGPGLALGREFRRLGVTTSVGRTIRLPAPNAHLAQIGPTAMCNSMCAFLLLGGIHRHVPPEARILVHQIWPSANRDDANAATYSASNVVSLQRALGQIAKYIVEMGADIELFEIASRIPPWENLRPLSRDDLRRMHIHTADDPFSVTSNLPAPMRPDSQPSSPPPPAPVQGAGWRLVDRSGTSTMTRTHPITIEGQNIGEFDIELSCGREPGTLSVEYREARIARPSSDRLNGVGLTVRNGKQLLRSVLKVQDTVLNESTNRIRSKAIGLIPFSFAEAMIQEEQTLNVATISTSKVATTVRLGRIGFPDGFKALSEKCSAAPQNNAN